MINISDEELKKIIIKNCYKKENFDCQEFEDQIKKALESDLESLNFRNASKYESDDLDLKLKKELEECINLENRILKTFDSL
jgi:vacuolar-type H+-ATPase subunit I/STV1